MLSLFSTLNYFISTLYLKSLFKGYKCKDQSFSIAYWPSFSLLILLDNSSVNEIGIEFSVLPSRVVLVSHKRTFQSVLYFTLNITKPLLIKKIAIILSGSRVICNYLCFVWIVDIAWMAYSLGASSRTLVLNWFDLNRISL